MSNRIDYSDTLRYSREYHAKHKESRNQAARLKRYRNKTKAVEYKGGKCAHCSSSFPPAVYDFHHIDPTEKATNLGHLFNWKWGSLIEAELDKCIMLCANCHRIETYGEFVDL